MSKKTLIILISLLLTANAFIIKQIFTSGNNDIKTDIIPASTPSPTVIQSPTPTIASSLRLSKESYTIALYGDSMVDTMGEKLEILQKELYRSYPKKMFKLFNYGIGAQNIEMGVARFENDFANKERVYPPITTIKPDIIILGTFAYNPFVPQDLEKYKTQLTILIQKSKNVTPQIYLLAEIGPKKTGFGEGEHGINWSDDQAYQQTLLIIEQLKAAINVANAQGIPVINAYEKSLVDDIFGNPIYVRSEDGIHPSYEGHVLMGKAIISSLKFY